jgi:cytidyltransferase-like protein
MTAPSPVLVTGSFDDVRSRDIRFLEEAAKLGSLTVLLWSDKAILQKQGKAPKFPEAERLYFLRALRYVNEARLVEGEISIGGPKPATWVVDAASDAPEKRNFSKTLGLRYHVLHDHELAGFPADSSASAPPTGRKRVIVTGCYDWFHSGHVRFFEEASRYGDLHVVVGHDANIKLLKGEGRPLFPEAERRYVVGSIRMVKQALVSSGHGWLDAEPEMKIIKPDIYAVNEDGDVPEKRDYCAKHGLQYLVLKRTPAPGLPRRSSTDLRGY